MLPYLTLFSYPVGPSIKTLKLIDQLNRLCIWVLCFAKQKNSIIQKPKTK